jgi:hypothetical protein
MAPPSIITPMRVKVLFQNVIDMTYYPPPRSGNLVARKWRGCFIANKKAKKKRPAHPGGRFA